MKRIRNHFFPFSAARGASALLHRLPMVIVLTATALLRELIRPKSTLRPLLLRIARISLAQGAGLHGKRGSAHQRKEVVNEVRARYKVKDERVL